jgi:rubrerythrin
MSKDELLKYILTAEKMEKDGLKFYRDSLKKATDPNSQGLLKFLVSEEIRHLAYFEGLEHKRTKVLPHVRPSKTPLFRKKDYAKMASKRSQTVHLFDKALEMEERGIRFYTAMAKKTKDAKVRRLLVHIANMEKDHFRLIKDHQRAIYDGWYWQAMEMPALNT